MRQWSRALGPTRRDGVNYAELEIDGLFCVLAVLLIALLIFMSQIGV